VGGRSKEAAPVIGVTGTGGAGKSTLTDELIRRFLFDFDDIRIAVLSVDPTRSRTGGALLGDRIRMNAIYGPDAERVYMRSFATRQAHLATSRALLEAIELCRESEFDIIFVETAGIGQSDTEISDLANLSVYVMTQEFGAPTQLEKIGMLDVADFVVLNKFEKRGSEDALRDVRRQLQRNRGAWDSDPDEMPVHPTMASHFNDPGVTRLYVHILESLDRDFDFGRTSSVDPALLPDSEPTGAAIIPPRRQRYLSDVAETVQSYRRHVEDQIDGARQWGQVVGTLLQLQNRDDGGEQETTERLTHLADQVWLELDAASRQILDGWDERFASYSGESTAYTVRDREIRADLYRQSLAGTKVPRVALPRAVDPGERLRFEAGKDSTMFSAPISTPAALSPQRP